MPSLTSEQTAHVVARYEAGESMDALAADLPITAEGLRKLLIRLGVSIRARGGFKYPGLSGTGAGIAHEATKRAIARGDLRRPSACERCGIVPTPYSDGRAAIQAHHDDYNRPLDVQWLCRSCHVLWHLSNAPVQRIKEDVEA